MGTAAIASSPDQRLMYAVRSLSTERYDLGDGSQLETKRPHPQWVGPASNQNRSGVLCRSGAVTVQFVVYQQAMEHPYPYPWS